MAAPKAVIGYQNYFEDTGAVIVADTELATFEKENAYDWRTATWWKTNYAGSSPASLIQYITVTLTTAKSVSYFAYFAHDLHTQGNSIQLQYSTNSGSSWNDATAEEIPQTDRPRMVTFDPISADMWRVRISLNSSPPVDSVIGVLAFGPVMEMQRGTKPGFAPSGYSNKSEFVNSISESGEFLGKSLIRRGEERTVQISNVTPAWVRSTWQPFAAHCETKPFFFLWDETSHPIECAYCVPISDPEAKYGHKLYMDVSVRCRCLVGNTTDTTVPTEV